VDGVAATLLGKPLSWVWGCPLVRKMDLYGTAKVFQSGPPARVMGGWLLGCGHVWMGRGFEGVVRGGVGKGLWKVMAAVVGMGGSVRRRVSRIVMVGALRV
jgi:hypothetical protein